MASKTRYPPPDGNFNQLVTDGAGNVGWAPRLAYTKDEMDTMLEYEGEFAIGSPVQDQPKPDIVAGNVYFITWDGVQYECIAYTVEGIDATCLGNGDLAEVSGGNGEPFFVGVLEGDPYAVLFASDSGTHSLSIAQKKQVVKTIDPSFLPDSEKALIVVIDMDDSDNYVASATYQEIADAITAGRYVMCVYGTEAFQLVISPVLSDIAPMIALPTHSFLNVGDAGTYATLKWIFIDSDNDVSFTTKKLTFAT